MVLASRTIHNAEVLKLQGFMEAFTRRGLVTASPVPRTPNTEDSRFNAKNETPPCRPQLLERSTAIESAESAGNVSKIKLETIKGQNMLHEFNR